MLVIFYIFIQFLIGGGQMVPALYAPLLFKVFAGTVLTGRTRRPRPMVEHKLESSLITTSDGRLVGLVLQKDVSSTVVASESSRLSGRLIAPGRCSSTYSSVGSTSCSPP